MVDVGVIVGRFQTHRLTKGHKELFRQVMEQHRTVLVLLGCTTVRCSRRNPLDYKSREKMLTDRYEDLTVLPIHDQPTDEGWSAKVDDTIRSIFPTQTIRLYGSRDSFVPHYHGQFPVVELADSTEVSGTQVRREASREVISSRNFRHGMIYAAYSRYPSVYMTVDVAVLRGTDVLLARKNEDPEGLYRFIGGFVSPGESLEVSAARELAEEAGRSLETSDMEYIGSYHVDDWRYRSERDKVTTALFVTDYLWGEAFAADDVDALKWFNLSRELPIVPEHRPLLDALLIHLEKE